MKPKNGITKLIEEGKRNKWYEKNKKQRRLPLITRLKEIQDKHKEIKGIKENKRPYYRQSLKDIKESLYKEDYFIPLDQLLREVENMKKGAEEIQLGKEYLQQIYANAGKLKKARKKQLLLKGRKEVDDLIKWFKKNWQEFIENYND